MKKAFITGITGQDGSYLAEFLLEKGYEVHGISRGINANSTVLDSRIKIYNCNITDYTNILQLLTNIKPNEIYHLASTNNVIASFTNQYLSFLIDNAATINLFEFVLNNMRNVKIFNASSSEIFGSTIKAKCNENTVLNPNSPYGMSKAYTFKMAQFYRTNYKLFICNGILFNHDSYRRNINNAVRKITSSIPKILKNEITYILLGNILNKKDYGFAKDYVKAMYLIMLHNISDDYIIASGKQHTLLDICKTAFLYVNLNWKKYILYNLTLRRTIENLIFGDISKIYNTVGWKPETTFNDYIKYIIDEELQHY